MADGVTQSSAAAALKLCSLAATWKVFKNLSDGKRMATTQNYTMSMEQQSCQPLKPFAYQALAKEKTRPMPCSRAVRASAARYWRVGGLITRAEPAADAPSIAARRQPARYREIRRPPRRSAAPLRQAAPTRCSSTAPAIPCAAYRPAVDPDGAHIPSRADTAHSAAPARTTPGMPRGSIPGAVVPAPQAAGVPPGIAARAANK